LAVELAATFTRLGLLHADLGDKVEGRRAYEQAIHRYETLLKSSPSDAANLQDKLAAAWQGLGDLEFATRRDEAHQSYERCVPLPEALVKADPASILYRKDLARVYNGLGLTERRIEAQFQAYHGALEIRLDLLNSIPEDPRLLHGLAESFNNIGQIVLGRGHREEALSLYRAGIEYGRMACERAPHLVEFALDYAILNMNAANLARMLERWDDTLAFVRASLRHELAFLRANQAIHDMRQQLWNSLRGCLNSETPAFQVDAYRSCFREVRELFVDLPKRSPDDHLNAAFAKVLYGQALGNWIPPASDTERARVQAEFDRALADIRLAIAMGLSDPKRLTTNWMFFPIKERQDFKALVADIEKPGTARGGNSGAIAASDQPAASAGRRRQVYDRASALLGVGLLQMHFKQTEESQRTFERAKAALEELTREEPQNVRYRAALARLRLAIGQLQWKTGRHQAASSELGNVAGTVAVGLKANPRDDEIANVGTSLSDFYAQLGLWEEAAELLYNCVASVRAAGINASQSGALEAQYRLLFGDRERFDQIVSAMAQSVDTTKARNHLIQTRMALA
jgi:tetratricopeptide (TPR) repeat protein